MIDGEWRTIDGEWRMIDGEVENFRRGSGE